MADLKSKRYWDDAWRKLSVFFSPGGLVPSPFGTGEFGGAVNALLNGCVGDGLADDTKTIQKAIDLAVANGTNTLYLPAGTYRITAAGLNSADAAVIVPSNFVIRGDGTRTVIKWEGDTRGGSEAYPAEPYYYCFSSLFGYTKVRYENLSFVGTNDPFVFNKNAQSTCIYAITGEDLVVKGCYFENLHGFSIHEDGNSERTHIFDCVTKNCANGINVNGNWTILTNNRLYNSEGFECAGTGVLIQNNTIKNALVCGISVGGNTVNNFEAPGSQVLGNNIDGCDGIGILGNNAFVYGTISGNTIRRCDGGGIYLTHDVGLHVVKNNIVSNNTVTDCCKAGNPNVSGIQVAGEGGNLITGNRVVDTGTGTWNQQYAIALLSNDNVVDGNLLKGTNHDLLINAGVTGTCVGQNQMMNTKVQWLATTGASEIRRSFAGAAGEYIEFSQIYQNIYPYWIRYADGKMEWGANTFPLDTNLYRSAANQLKTDDELVAVTGLAIDTQKLRRAASIPVAGTWVRGDIVFNTDPSAGGFIGWVCTASGTPGTWKTFGAISA